MNIILTEQKCVVCEGGVPPLSRAEANSLMKQTPGWKISDDAKKISRKYEFKNFKEALAFVDRVGALAESESHHPNIHMDDFKFVTIELWTHAIDGLSQNDFILAAKIDLPH